MDSKPTADPGRSGSSACRGEVSARFVRRNFLKVAGASIGAVAGGIAAAPRIAAGPVGPADFAALVPTDKKLDPSWVAALTDRGSPETHVGDELQTIGMPVGGIGAGQLYLGGDGRLWHWDIFNGQVTTDEEHYAKPLVPDHGLAQGYAIRVRHGDTTDVRTLDAAGCGEVSFRGEYPVGRVLYADDRCPVRVTLEAFSPFVPLDADSSSFPATILQFTVSNPTDRPATVELAGWLENPVARASGRILSGSRFNRPVTVLLGRDGDSITLLEMGIVPLPAAAVDRPARRKPDEEPPVDPTPGVPLAERFDFGTVAFGLVDRLPDDRVIPAAAPGADVFREPAGHEATRAAGRPIGAVVRTLAVPPRGTATAAFVVAWHFPNLEMSLAFHSRRVTKSDPPVGRGRWYATRFPAAVAVAQEIATRFEELRGATFLWRDTWRDSTLPHWFLERTLVPVSTLATNTCYRLGDGRFYGWEGVGSCAGTCTHVWHYEQAMGRLFPELDRSLRIRVDYNPAIGFDQRTGGIGQRGDSDRQPAVDGQAGTILRAYRDHLVSDDDSFLASLWPRIRRSVEWLMDLDGDGDGLLDKPQANTLDATWYGVIPWISGLALAAVAAAERMAAEMKDESFESRCREYVARGRAAFVAKLFNGEYFEQIPDPVRRDEVGSYDGCEIDQVLGQGWAFQVGLGRVLPETETKRALAALWRYNFTPDVGPYRERHQAGRWFAMPGEAGTLMCSWPKGDALRVGKKFDYYFNECMTGFEHQLAGHMIWEGMVQEGLAVERAVHDRYHPSRRNPFNEVECGDHYVRSLASYGVFLAACGFEYHGPRGHIGFAPRIGPERFRSAFTAAAGWGTYEQSIDGLRRLTATITVKHGRLRLRTIALQPWATPARLESVSIRDATVSATLSGTGGRTVVSLPRDEVLRVGDACRIVIAS